MFAQNPGVDTASDVATEVSASISAGTAARCTELVCEEASVFMLPHTKAAGPQRSARAARAAKMAGSSTGRAAIAWCTPG
mmetsp:Transcript_89432/g.248401  ORF Transcript_89432/g.248401 Transcript_89432/m.248401 type:complete len:80 (+) Transcript_89432:198-437(+)